MNGDIQAARKLLSELREAYESLPGPLQLKVKCLLRESTSPKNHESATVQPYTSFARQREYSLGGVGR
jgi:hypothetical protein